METSRDGIENCIHAASSALLPLTLVYFPRKRLKLFIQWPAQQAGPPLFLFIYKGGYLTLNPLNDIYYDSDHIQSPANCSKLNIFYAAFCPLLARLLC